MQHPPHLTANMPQNESAQHNLFTCPCCGYLMFSEPPGSYDICPICFWEDDGFQLYYPEQSGGANPSSLLTAQVNFIQFGACDRAMASKTRTITPDDIRDERWFPLWMRKVHLPDADTEPSHPQATHSMTDLYYWLRTE
ncbi:CPCC family cysteine-rich protein [Corticimicrobacter populi]|nr:CPCC family cysteine-rich protein [Corticimicrobacter populi]